MDFKFVNTKISLDEGVLADKFLANRAIARNPEQVKAIFIEHGYDLTNVPGEFVKTLTFDDKEMYELGEVLDEIHKLGLREIFNANLRPSSFKRSLLERVKHCLDNNIPFVNSDNTFVDSLVKDEIEALEENKTIQEDTPSISNNTALDMEDLEVKSEIIKVLGEINAKSNDPVVTFITTSIINNLDMAIMKSAKEYRVLGLRSIIENALVGVVLDPEMQELVNNEILSAFPLEEERGL